MSKFLIFLFLTAVPSFANSPEEAFDELLNALYSGDAEALYNSLSSESIAMLNMMMLMLKAQPEEAATEISDQLEIVITADEISEWTSMDLISTVLAAPGFIEEFPPREHISVLNSSISGDSSTVFFTVGDIPETFELLLVRQGENWKLDQSVIQAEL